MHCRPLLHLLLLLARALLARNHHRVLRGDRHLLLLRLLDYHACGGQLRHLELLLLLLVVLLVLHQLLLLQEVLLLLFLR